MVDLMRQIMRGDVSPTLVAAIVTGLRVKKETIGEIAGAARVMRELAATVDVGAPDHFVDIVGTGGDGAHVQHLDGEHVRRRGGREEKSPSTATAAYRRNPAAPTCSKRLARRSTSRPNKSLPCSATPASASCSRRAITRR
jgi:hypothetical protein